MDEKASNPGVLYVSEHIATDDWVRELELRHPLLVGQIGRPPTRKEIRFWWRRAHKKKLDLIARKIQYHQTALKRDMILYLKLRQSCGYIEGVPVPDWLFHAAEDPERGVRGVKQGTEN